MNLQWHLRPRSPGLTFASIIATPHPLNGPKWLSSLDALAPQAQQNSYSQKAQVIWLQPWFFSIFERHWGQKDTLPLFSSAQPSSWFVIASSQVTFFPCHVSRQLKQTSVEHFGHFNFSTLSFAARMYDSQLGLVHQRINGSDSIDFLSLNLSYFSSSSFWPWSVKIYASLA